MTLLSGEELAARAGFALVHGEGRTATGERLCRGELPGVGTHFFVLLGESGTGDVLLCLEPGLCKVTYVDGDGSSVGQGEWLVFGGETPVPRNCAGGPSPAALIVVNVRL